jgi:DNA-binding transcriptional LysR family regulator
MRAMKRMQIGYFLALCNELHFTRAARRCGISHPSLSNAIQALEREIGGPLFRRKPRLRLSELGRSLQPHLRQALADITRARSMAAAAAPRSSVRADRGSRRGPPHFVENPGHVTKSLA